MRKRYRKSNLPRMGRLSTKTEIECQNQIHLIVLSALLHLTAENIFCVERDTTYCGDPGDDPFFGPYIVLS